MAAWFAQVVPIRTARFNMRHSDRAKRVEESLGIVKTLRFPKDPSTTLTLRSG